MESAAADRTSVTLADHVEAICDAVREPRTRSSSPSTAGPGGAGYAASDRVPERIAAMVYVDSGPATGALDPELLDGRASRFRRRTRSPPRRTSTGSRRSSSRRSGAARCRSRARSFANHPSLTNDARLDVPTTVICTGFSSEQVKEAVSEGYAWLGGFTELRNVTWIDLPTSHWPMWSRPHELAAVLSDVARSAGRDPDA